MTKADVLSIALSLPREERADLAMRLLESLDAPAEALAQEAAWEAEIIRRLEARDRGEGEARPASEVLAELRSKLRG